MTQLRNLRRPAVTMLTGYPNSTLYGRIRAGLFPRPIKTGAWSVAWPSEEVEALLQAQRHGIDEAGLKALVQRLHARREDALIGLAA